MNKEQSEEDGRIALVDGKGLRGIWAVFNMIGGVAGLLAMLTVALVGGEIKKQVEVNSKRLDTIEQGGSPTVKALTQALTAEAELRRETDNTTARRLDDTRTDLNQRIQNITQLLEKLIAQQSQLITLIKVQQQIDNKP